MSSYDHEKFSDLRRASGKKFRAPSPRAKPQPYNKVRRALKSAPEGWRDVIQGDPQSQSLAIFATDSLYYFLLTKNRAARIYNSVYATANSNKRAILNFNELIDEYVKEVNQATPQVNTNITGFDIFTSRSGGRPNFIIGCVFDEVTEKLLADQHVSLIEKLAPGNTGLLSVATYRDCPHMGVAGCREEATAIEVANRLTDSKLMGAELEFKKAIAKTS